MGGEAEAALPDGQRGNAELARQRGVGVPVELRVIVGMQVNGTGSHDAAAGVQFLGAAGVDAPANHRHAAVLDGKVAAEPGDSGAINHGAAADYNVKLRHTISSYGLSTID